MWLIKDFKHINIISIQILFYDFLEIVHGHEQMVACTMSQHAPILKGYSHVHDHYVNRSRHTDNYMYTY